MALSKKDLVKKAKKLEVEELEKHNINSTRFSDLDQLLNDAFAIWRPKPIDYHNRRELIRIFNAIAKEIYGNTDDIPIVEGFGSFVMDMFNTGSDLDLSVNFSNNRVEFPRQKRIRALRKFAKKFQSLQRGGHVAGIQVITSAKVPIVKLTDQGTGVECDLSIENRDGIVKSEIMHIISAIDERFQKLSCLMKAWAKSHGVNSSKDRTLNSLSIISMVAFHLQTRDPPILPPFSALFKDGTDPAVVMKVVHNYSNYGKENKESLAKLFITLFIKLASVEKLWLKGLCISLYEGSWTLKKLGSINVEDFTDKSENVARAVGLKEVKTIYKFIHQSLLELLRFLDGNTDGPKLKNHLFGIGRVNKGDKVDKSIVKLPTPAKECKMDRVTQKCGAKRNIDKSTGKIPVNQDPPRPAKKMCVMTGREATNSAKGWGGTHLARGWGGRQLTRGWGQTQFANGWGQTQFANGWGGTRLNEGSQGSWHRESWGGMQHAKEWGGIPIVNAWGGWQNVDDWERKLQHADNWGAKKPSYHYETSSSSASHFNPLVPHHTLSAAPSFDTKIAGFGGGSYAHNNQNLLGFDIVSPTAPQPYNGHLHLHPTQLGQSQIYRK